MPKCSAYIATSLDGLIARKNGELDWLPGSDGDSDGEDYGYNAFINSVDALIMGRKTYEFVSSFPVWPYKGKRVVVLSSNYSQSLQSISAETAGTSMPPAALLAELGNLGVQHVYVDGGTTIQGFLRHRLLDEIIITRIPVLIGEGISLFGYTGNDIWLRHIATQSFASGLVQSRYAVEISA